VSEIAYICGVLPHELEEMLVAIGQKAYRARQILRWVYARGADDLDAMTDLPQALRQSLAGVMQVNPAQDMVHRRARDGSLKLALRLPDGAVIESVLMPYGARATVCVSSQVGCAYNCAFCATGSLGFERDLTAAEIVGQVLRAKAASELRVTNVVFMGMGEPLANYEAVIKAVRVINHPACGNIGARHIAVSTCGLPEGIRRLASEGLEIHLAVSLNAPDDRLRSRLMPVTHRYPLRDVIAAAAEYAAHTGRKISFEYCLLAGVNDSVEQARATAALIRGIPCMVNVILYNQARGGFRRPSARAVRAFTEALRERGIEAATRRSFGEEVAAACGQLAASSETESGRRRRAAP
jgi:23S rRNA (adenine2503-C2)-methyltransferase